jgi:hypothetical protein
MLQGIHLGREPAQDRQPQSRESWSGHDFAVHEAEAGMICRQFVTIVRIILRRPTD